MDAELKYFLDDAVERAHNDPVRITIRELLAKWGAKRRGYWIVEDMQADLLERGLSTEPPFTEGWIDSEITVVSVDAATAEDERDPTSDDRVEEVEREAESTRTFLRVGNLQSATAGVVGVRQEHGLAHAESLMMRHDYSQIAVLSGPRELVGAVSWESIAQARIRSSQAELRDAIVRAEDVMVEDDLLSHIPRIIDAGFVFVRRRDKTICGIVTTADLSEEFSRLANPFFLIGEIERRLRRAIDGRFKPEELRQLRDPEDSAREVNSVDDLTIGEQVRLLERPECWQRMGWQIDKKVFVETLHEIRVLRNEVMHFSPDPLEDHQVAKLRNFIKWLRLLEG
ncbi:MAG: hypothetical protein ACRDZO_05860 [Egibacteraceae bacterium]